MLPQTSPFWFLGFTCDCGRRDFLPFSCRSISGVRCWRRAIKPGSMLAAFLFIPEGLRFERRADQTPSGLSVQFLYGPRFVYKGFVTFVHLNQVDGHITLCLSEQGLLHLLTFWLTVVLNWQSWVQNYNNCGHFMLSENRWNHVSLHQSAYCNLVTKSNHVSWAVHPRSVKSYQTATTKSWLKPVNCN